MYETDRRKIYQLADRLRLQANFWNSNEQGFADLFSHRDIKNSVDTAKREGIAEGMELGMKQGMEKGRTEGKHEANTETAQRLLEMGLSAEQVAKATQLPLEIIKNLSNS